MIVENGEMPTVQVIGHEFPGIDPRERRPVVLEVPKRAGASFGARVDQLLRWSFDPRRE